MVVGLGRVYRQFNWVCQWCPLVAVVCELVVEHWGQTCYPSAVIFDGILPLAVVLNRGVAPAEVVHNLRQKEFCG